MFRPQGNKIFTIFEELYSGSVLDTITKFYNVTLFQKDFRKLVFKNYLNEDIYMVCIFLKVTYFHYVFEVLL